MVTGQASAFVLALGQRHTGRLDKRPFIGFIFRQVRPVASQPLYQQTHVHVAPRLSLQMLAAPRVRPEQAGRPAAVMPIARRPAPRQVITLRQRGQHILVHTAAHSAPAGTPLPIRTFVRRPGTEQWRTHRTIEATVRHLQTHHQVHSSFVEQTVQRFVRRGERVEVVSFPRRPFAAATRQPEAAPGARPAKPESPSLPPVPRIVRRPAFATKEQAPETAVAAPPFTPAAGPVPSAARPVAAPPHLDVNVLTNQVVRLIDQRINANRERMGRL